MFCKKNETGYQGLLDGLRLKTLVHGEKTLMAEFRIPRNVNDSGIVNFLLPGLTVSKAEQFNDRSKRL